MATSDSPRSIAASRTLQVVRAAAPTGALTALARRFTIRRGFEGTVGVKTSLESDGFGGDDGNSLYSSEQAATGLTSGKMTIRLSNSDGGFGGWGGVIGLPQKLQQGDELFLRFRQFYQPGFNFYTTGGGGHVKFLRVRTETPAGANKGYADVYWQSAGQATTYKFIKEFSPNLWQYFGSTTTHPHITGQWVTYNVSILWHSDPAQGRYRVWRDGDLLADLSVTTLSDAADVATAFYLFTYWNGTVPQEQSCYIDDLVITSDRAETVVNAGTGYNWVGA
jgi:hypothetical protein